MSSSDSTSSGRNYTYVMEGFQELRRALEPFVEKCMTAEYGNAWRDHAVSVLKQGGVEVSHYDAIKRDAWKLLRLMRDDPKPFSAILQSRGEQLVYKPLAIRHESHHDQELELSDASHAYDCFCETFQLIDYPAPEFEARRVTLHSLAAQASQPPAAAAALTGDAVEGLRNGSKEAVDGRSATGQEGGTSNDDTPSPWVGDDDLHSAFSNRGSASPVFNPKKKALVVAGTMIGLLAVGGLIQLMNFQGSSRPNVLAESASTAQTVTSRASEPSVPGTSPNVSTVSKDPPLSQPQSSPDRESVVGRRDVSRGSSARSDSEQPAASDPPPTPATPLDMKATSHGFTYDLESCNASGTTVRCVFCRDESGRGPTSDDHR